MGDFRNLFLGLLLAAVGASAYDTTIAYSGGRQSGTFKMDGRANMTSSSRSDIPDTVRFGMGLTLSRVVNKGGGCILSTSYPIPTWIRFHFDQGLSGFSSADSNFVWDSGGVFPPRPRSVWDSAVAFPAQLRSLDSIPNYLSPCGGGWPYGFGFPVSSDDMNDAVVTFRALHGHDRIVYHRNGNIHLKLQVAGFETISTDCGDFTPVTNCTHGDKVVFRYVLTDDSTGYFGSEPMSLRPSTRARLDAKTVPEAWRSRLYRLILGRDLPTRERP